VPFDVAFAMDDTMRDAFSIIVSEQQTGTRFDWNSGEFVKPT